MHDKKFVAIKWSILKLFYNSPLMKYLFLSTKDLPGTELLYWIVELFGRRKWYCILGSDIETLQHWSNEAKCVCSQMANSQIISYWPNDEISFQRTKELLSFL